MSETKKSLIAAGWIVAACGAFLIGSNLRDRADLSAAPTTKLDNLVASRNGGAPQGGDEIPAGDFFYSLTEKLKKEYVEPINDEQKLASGAVRGMVGYLADPKSVYMDKDAFRVFLNARQGKYEGIGADLALLLPSSNKKANRSALQPTPTEEGADPRQQALSTDSAPDQASFPRLTVTSVVPGGPADKAGVKPGDIVYSIDGHWLLNADLSIRFMKARKLYDQKKLPLADLNALRKEVRDKWERMILPLRARDRLFAGTAGNVKVVWERNGEQRATTIQRAPSSRTGFQAANGVIQLPFTPGSPEALKQAIAGKPEVTLDLRNNTLGDFSAMRQCLAVLAPAGQYGVLTTNRSDKTTPFAIGQGNANPPKITLITDRTTRGAAEIFALALSSKGLAKLSGSETGGDRDIYDIVELPDGTGYTLVTSHFKPSLDTKSARLAKNGGRK
ncbi:S41 family peptidase [Fimbriimonas ginsengisoli]|uniref:Putative protease n=1 Tax=Fimbriimonas ginsengisoli Gsoil 348 TaxID=661478 RepID=A0A068NL52_FIMGI|nr:S41 family peptidase [Fimbriimonas ginsengisoli]AIE83495.1 putative protease [Fimbriimonas ginsengisoli Gsoil 348]